MAAKEGLTHAVGFFDRQFSHQIQERDYALNPFELAVLPHLRGEVLDLGCGLGNLSLAAAEAGCSVTAVDASPNGIADLTHRAYEGGLKVEASVADLRHYPPARQYDCVVAIGLLMFFACPQARALLRRLPAAVKSGGIAAVNVLTEGTTYMAMFDPADHCLFHRDELTAAFPDWQTVLSRHEDFPAPGGTTKRFHTLVVRKT